MRRYGVVTMAAVAALSVWPLSAVAAKPKMITICHVPPGNTGNPQTLTLPVATARMHLRQHPDDYRGPCKAATSSTSAPSTTNATTSTSTSTPTTTTATTTTPNRTTTSNPTQNDFLELSARCGPQGAFFPPDSETFEADQLT